ncbi:MAG: Gx transporter family protein [Lachnospiraceae bacterium]|nr:Gx transporter family protein [Lachnospiraceae bacterium]MBR5066802.1 Gx transporter family protein [Lachnospiraceae bacterium]MBR5916896.1 Gx transporter family protein [Lachnospiraceae bacterium]
MKKTTKITFLGLFTAVALVLSFLETLIPNMVPIPGFKIGLANFAVLLALYLFGFKEAVIVDLARIILAALLFGSFFSFWYALSGAVCALIIELIIKKTDKFSPIGVSVFGAIFHNLGQFLVAVILIKSLGILYYLPFTLLFCVLSGALNGYLVLILKDRLKFLKKND